MGPELAAAGTAAGAGAGAAGLAIPTEVALGLMAGGTAAQMLAARQQARQQRGILNRAFEQTDRTVNEGTEQVLDEAGKAAPSGQADAMRAAAEASAARTMQDIRGAGGDMIDTAGRGAVSDAFTRRRGEVQALEGDRLAQIAQEVGRVRAPGQVAADSAIRRGALAERIGSMYRGNERRAQAAQLDAQNVDRPWYGDVGQLASMVGGLSLAGGAGAAPQSAAPATMGEMIAGSASATAPAFAAGSSAPSWLGQVMGMYSQNRRPSWMAGGAR